MDIEDREEYLQSIGLELGWNKNLVKCQICHGRWHSAEYETCYDCRPPWLRFHRREFTQDQRIDIMERDDYKCVSCGTRDEYLQIDHVKPCALGGEADLWNGQVLCGACNLRKAGNWWNTEWPEKRIRLMHMYLTFGWPFLGYEERELLVTEALGRRSVVGYHKFSGIVESAWLESAILDQKIIIIKQTPMPLANGEAGPSPQFVNIVDAMMVDSRPVFYGERFTWHAHVSGVREPADWVLMMADDDHSSTM